MLPYVTSCRRAALAADSAQHRPFLRKLFNHTVAVAVIYCTISLPNGAPGDGRREEGRGEKERTRGERTKEESMIKKTMEDFNLIISAGATRMS